MVVVHAGSEAFDAASMYRDGAFLLHPQLAYRHGHVPPTVDWHIAVSG
jgi:hypothetical protein